MKKWMICLLALSLLCAGCNKKADTQVQTTEGTTAVDPVPQFTVEQTSQPAGENMAPAFRVYDWEGNALTMGELAGKPVILNFWASWCGPCKAELPAFQMAYDHYGKEFQFVMVNLTDGVSETVETAQAVIQEGGYTFPVYFDTSMEASYYYGITSIPTTFFIAADGTAVAYHTGMMGYEELEAGMEMLRQHEADQ